MTDTYTEFKAHLAAQALRQIVIEQLRELYPALHAIWVETREHEEDAPDNPWTGRTVDGLANAWQVPAWRIRQPVWAFTRLISALCQNIEVQEMCKDAVDRKVDELLANERKQYMKQVRTGTAVGPKRGARLPILDDPAAVVEITGGCAAYDRTIKLHPSATWDAHLWHGGERVMQGNGRVPKRARAA